MTHPSQNSLPSRPLGLAPVHANVNAEGGTYGKALSTASHWGHEEVVRLLLETGANDILRDQSKLRKHASTISAPSWLQQPGFLH